MFCKGRKLLQKRGPTKARLAPGEGISLQMDGHSRVSAGKVRPAPIFAFKTPCPKSFNSRRIPFCQARLLMPLKSKRPCRMVAACCCAIASRGRVSACLRLVSRQPVTVSGNIPAARRLLPKAAEQPTGNSIFRLPAPGPPIVFPAIANATRTIGRRWHRRLRCRHGKTASCLQRVFLLVCCRRMSAFGLV